MIRIYVEGGFEGSTKSDCRRAFSTFLGRIIHKSTFKVIASGSRQNAYKDFCSGLRQHPGDYIILLVDSEAAVTTAPWRHLRTREGDQWQRPAGTDDDQAQLMVQSMETWFLADPGTLSTYYGQRFLHGSLPRQSDIEQIDKGRVFDCLRHASKPTQKGAYQKIKHGFDLLETIDPDLVRAASPHTEKLSRCWSGGPGPHSAADQGFPNGSHFRLCRTVCKDSPLKKPARAPEKTALSWTASSDPRPAQRQSETS